MSSSSGSTTVAASSPFTVSQWQELEHQALIYKYLLAGLPIPPDLVLPIQNGFHMLSSPFFHHSSLGYTSMFGKKVDPEPGRCRRTDGKKWRCSKEAHPDSKYCERHMHRGRSRSRKPVESHSLSSSSSSAAAVLGVGSHGRVCRGGGNQTPPLSAFASESGSDRTQLQLDSIPYAIPSKDYARYIEGQKPEAGERSFFSECSGGSKGSTMYSVGNTWPFESNQVSSYIPTKPAEISVVQLEYSQHSFLNCEFGLSQPGNQGSQSLRPFFELTNSNDTWPSLEDERVNKGSFSVTHSQEH